MIRPQSGLNEPALIRLTAKLLMTDALDKPPTFPLISTKALVDSLSSIICGILIVSVALKDMDCLVSKEKKYLGFLTLMTRTSRSRLVAEMLSGELKVN